MRILWVKVGGLWPLETGGRIRSVRMLTELARRHRVSLLTTHRDPQEADALGSALAGCERVESLPHDPPKAGDFRFVPALARSWLSPFPIDVSKWVSPPLRRRVRAELASGEVDVCIADFLVSFGSVPRPFAVPVVLFEHNVEHLIWRRLAESEPGRIRRALLEIEWRKMRGYEARACARASLTVTVSSTDRDELARVAPEASFRVAATGVDTTFFRPNGGREDPAKLVFTGSMDWYPNEDAIARFVQESFPRIRREVPGASLSVVGRSPGPRLRRLEGDGVHVTGTVADVRPYIEEAAVYVVPLRVGSGTRLKIFEALAMGKAVVSTGVGAEGLPLVPGVHYVRADEPEAFARATLSLLRDPARRRELGLAGRKLVREAFDWSHVTRAFESDLKELVETS